MIASELKSREYDRACPACAGEVRLLYACERCRGTGLTSRRCRSCFVWQGVVEFLSGGRLVRACAGCRSGRRAHLERRPPSDGARLRVHWCSCSRNGKTGPIPVSMTSADTCPTSCPWRGAGCYAEHYFVGMHWRRLSAGGGTSWGELLSRVRALPGGQLWRHNEAGDLPGTGDEVDALLLSELCEASMYTRGFTYTHKPVVGSATADHNRGAIARATSRGGLVVNLSADGLDQADVLADLGVCPVVVTLPEHNPSRVVTPSGRRVVICPAVSREGVSCATCGLCAKPWRRSIVGFPAHGDMRRSMSARLGPQLSLF